MAHMIEIVFAILLITTADGKIIEHTPMYDSSGVTSLSKCLEEKRKVTKQIDQSEGIMVSCQSVEAEVYTDCVTPDTCRVRIKKIIN